MPRMQSVKDSFRKWAQDLSAMNLKKQWQDKRDSLYHGSAADGTDLQLCTKRMPMEILLQIAVLAASTSQEAYCRFSLVSRDMRNIVEREALPYLPIRLESAPTIIAFHKVLVRRPELATRVRHLWIRGARSRQKPKQGYSEPTSQTWRQFKASAFEQLFIINACTRLVSLACSFPVMFLCFRFTRDIFFKHDQLKELTLFENWNLWACFTLEPPVDGPHLFLQLTHLTIFDSVAPHFPAQLFPSLRYFSAEIVPAFPQAALEAFDMNDVLKAPLPQTIKDLPRDVLISLFMVDHSERGAKEVTSEDERRWLMRVGNPQFFQWWSARIWGDRDVWTLK